MQENDHHHYASIIGRLTAVIIFLLALTGVLGFWLVNGVPDFLKMEALNADQNKEALAKVVEFNRIKSAEAKANEEKQALWSSPDITSLAHDEQGDLVRYGRELISNTSKYLGPKGSVAQLSNGMNCQNCHLDAGTKPFGNNYSAVAPTYPKFRERSGSIESVYKRVNDCFERSLNGIALDTLGKEMHAIKAYILWLGQDLPKKEKPKGAGLTELKYLSRPADPTKGRVVYMDKCKRCHEENGEGKLNSDGLSYTYPPLWGEHSYNIGAGLYRLSRFAGYVKSNMPQGATYDNPQLTDEEAWDVAAFVNSQPRPQKDLGKDWPKISGKPVDHPFGPYADNFSEQQHKYGPFEPIAALKKKNNTK